MSIFVISTSIQCLYKVYINFTKVVSKFWGKNKVINKKITSTSNLVKSEFFIYNITKTIIQSFLAENLTLD